MSEENSEQRAMDSGWTPKEDFKGDPEKWISAEEWNSRADTMLPLIKAERKKTAAENQRLKTDLTSTKEEIAQLKKTLKQVITLNENISQRAYDRAKETLLKEKKAAIQNNDGEAFEAAEKQEAELDKAKPVKVDTKALETEKPGVQYSEPQQSFFERNNTWYEVDPEMTGFAKRVALRLQASGVVDHAEQLKGVETEVKEKYPEFFGNTRRGEQAVAGTTNLPPKKKGEASFDSLPPEFKKMFDTLKKDFPDYTKKQFLKDMEE